MNIKHTPGPWYFGASAHEDAEFIVGIAKPDDRGEGFNPHVALVRNSKAALANARLIAAAPELLEALVDCLAKFTDSQCIKSISWTQARDRGRVAIAKAKGISP